MLFPTNTLKAKLSFDNQTEKQSIQKRPFIKNYQDLTQLYKKLAATLSQFFPRNLSIKNSKKQL